MSKKFALIGEKLPHTMSPPIHKRLFEMANINGEYETIEIPKGELENFINQLKTLDGFNVTIPYKQDIIPFLAELSSGAKLHQSVNTVTNKNGKLIGDNTDCYGFLKTLEENGVALNGNVCVIGVGGVGRMIAIECALRCKSLTLAILERHKDKAFELKEYLQTLANNCEIKISLTDEINNSFDVVINSTPVGMFPHINESPLEKEQLKNVCAVFDCIYNPKETVFMKFAKENGAKVVGGMGMLIYQAVRAEEIWNGINFDYKTQVSKLIEEFGANIK